jgi:hypothetical protein
MSHERIYSGARISCTTRRRNIHTIWKWEEKVFRTPSGQSEPSTHKARILIFNNLADHTKPYFAIHSRLGRIATVQARNDALYYDPMLGQLPEEKYDNHFAGALVFEVRALAQEIWQEIR